VIPQLACRGLCANKHSNLGPPAPGPQHDHVRPWLEPFNDVLRERRSELTCNAKINRLSRDHLRGKYFAGRSAVLGRVRRHRPPRSPHCGSENQLQCALRPSKRGHVAHRANPMPRCADRHNLRQHAHNARAPMPATQSEPLRSDVAIIQPLTGQGRPSGPRQKLARSPTPWAPAGPQRPCSAMSPK
jgi:hypothetical protein